MKRLLRIFALLMAASMLIWFMGCGDDDDDDNDEPPPLELQSTVPAANGTVPGNGTLTWNFNRQPTEASVAGVAGTAAIQGNSVVVTPSADMPAGPLTATLTADGDSFPLSVTVTAVDRDPPALAGASCDPKDGADGVDPADYPEKLVVEFSEDLSDATVTATDPEFKFTPTLSGKTLEIAFLQYSMPNETEFEIKITATDIAANKAELVYSFTTMAKEQ
jgi:hypothetical protein